MSDFEVEIYPPYDTEFEIRSEKKYLSKVFFSLFGAWLLGYGVIMTIAVAGSILFPLWVNNEWFDTILNCIYTPSVALFFMLFQIGNKGKKHRVKCVMKTKSAFRLFVISLGIMYGGAIIGTFFSEFCSTMVGNELENTVEEMVDSMGYGPVIVSAVVFAPIFEEILFRKLLIDRISKYGTFFSAVVSGFVFGLYHGNFYQFFYAFGLGVLLGYIYCLFGKVRYTIILHAIINLIGSVVPMALDDLSAFVNPNLDLTMIYGFFYVSLCGLGVFFIIRDLKWFRLFSEPGILQKPMKAIWSGGFITLMVLGSLSFLMYMAQ